MTSMPSNTETAMDDENRLICSSTLLKRSSKTHQWRKRWFVLRMGQLNYYKDSKEYKALNVINRSNLLSFSVIPDHHKFHFAIYTNKKVIHLKAESEDIFKQWTVGLATVINDSLDGGISSTSTMESNVTKTLHSSKMTKQKSSKMEESSEDDSIDSDFTSGASDSNMSPSDYQTITAPPIVEEEEEGEESSRILEEETRRNGNKEYIMEKGYLLRLRKHYNQWRRFYIILTNKSIYFYKSKSDRKPAKTLQISDIVDVIELDPLSRTKVWCLLIITRLKRIRFCAETEDDLLKWLVPIKTLVLQRKEEIVNNMTS